MNSPRLSARPPSYRAVNSNNDSDLSPHSYYIASGVITAASLWLCVCVLVGMHLTYVGVSVGGCFSAVGA